MFAERLIAWQRVHGRNGLPWQRNQDPYSVWLSEVMLQQTQVSTVLRYFDRFLDRFPKLAALADAPLDEVLAVWSGLGYYSRARLMHDCARQVRACHDGVFPQTASQLEQLPGIGPSTAAAIASTCFGETVSIFDGNVQRVLARFLAFEGDLSDSAPRRALKHAAERLLPTGADPEHMRRYTQGLMDLGALICTPKAPRCGECPMQDICHASRVGRAKDLPLKTRRLRRSTQSIWLLIAQRTDGAVWLVQRPPRGVWGGLFTFPLFDTEDGLAAAVAGRDTQTRPTVVHVLTHKDLHLHPRHLLTEYSAEGPGCWAGPDRWNELGLPAPIRRLLNELIPARDVVSA